MSRAQLVFALLLSCFIVGGYLIADWSTNLPADAVATYVGRDSCIECHQQQVELFTGSHHDKAMDVANDETVLADFNNQSLEHYGVTSRMFRDGDRFMVHTEGPDGKMADFEVKYTFGVEPLQQYMVVLDRGQVQVLRLSWDTQRKKWFYLSPPDVESKLDPTDPLHWTGITQNWNSSCAFCHSTNLEKNFDLASATWNTTWSEIDVSCEACHGPAGLHNELMANQGIFPDRNHGTGLAKLKTVSNIAQVESCAPCHSRRTQVVDGWKPGCNFDDYFALQPLTEPIYFADGQIRDEDYVHGSFIQSKMYHAGIKCSDCHDPHSLKLKHDGNNVCTSCHQHPAGKYDSELHHHHKTGTEGAKCVNCHMPSTTYMMVDARRDHSFRVPRPDLSQLHGTPNACTKCHLELETALKTPDGEQLPQYLDWMIAAETGNDAVADLLKQIDGKMAVATAKWYPRETSPIPTAWYPELAAAQSQIRKNMDAGDQLAELLTKRSYPALTRATAAVNLGLFSDYKVTIRSLDDDDIKVVSAAISGLQGQIGYLFSQLNYAQDPRPFRAGILEITERLAFLLSHPSKRIRGEAANVLLELPAEVRVGTLSDRQRLKFNDAIDQHIDSLMLARENAGAHIALGQINERMARIGNAESDYRNAIRLSPYTTGPRSNLASLLEQKARYLAQAAPSPAAKKEVLRLTTEVRELRKRDHELLGIDVGRVEGLAGTDALHYRFAMSSWLQDDAETAEKYLLRAFEQNDSVRTYALGLTTFYIEQKEFEKAEKFVDHLLKIDPGHPAHLNLKKQIESQKSQ